jgi:hypothetical protein
VLGEDKTMPDQPGTQEDLDNEIGRLNLAQMRILLHWLVVDGPDTDDARAVQRGLDAVRRIEAS